MFIEKNLIESLLRVQDRGNSGMKLTYKISDFHINLSGTQRQKVKKAAQLLSRTVSKAIQYYGNNDIMPLNWKEVIFIK